MIGVYSGDSITLKSKTSDDQWNTTTYSSSTVSCRIEYKTQLVKNQAGEDVKSEIMIFLENDISVNHGDKVLVNSKEYAIIKIDQRKDFSLSHTEIYL